ncbi:MAG TPA: hypothetical protein DHV59_00125 [Oxalobacteraceae bacterium]|nr:hypothetical protein [Oxalobacteraceae bacterium]
MPSVTLWLLDGRVIQKPELTQLEHQLSPPQAQRFARFRRPERQRQYLLGRTLLRHAIGHATGMAPAAVGTVELPGAAPLLVLPESLPCPAFSLSHSCHWIACATSAGTRLGIDIEVIDERRDVLALAEAAFDADEYAFIRSQSDAARVPAFYRLWTMKEALFKRWSSAGRPDKPPPLVNSAGELQVQGDGWACSFMEHPQLAICICSALPLAEITKIAPPALAF